MGSRISDEFESGIGDISAVTGRTAGLADLSWLDVNEEDYRALEALPKQNLDTIPELQSALSWDGKDSRVPSVNPLRPHTVVNQNPLDTPEATLRSNSSIPNRLAAYVMAGIPDAEIARRMRLEFSPEQLSASHAEASKVLDEKGLLANVYVDASHFPRCAQEGPHREFVAKTSKRALFVLSKQACGGCVCNKSGSCSAFKKRLVSEVPYEQKLAAHYLPVLKSENRVTPSEVRTAAVGNDVKAVLRAAFLRPVATAPVDQAQRIIHQDVPRAPVVTEADVRSFWDRRMASLEAEAMPGPMYLLAAKKLMQGHADVASLRASSDSEVRSLAKEHGIIGHTYLDGDALGGVRPTWSFLRERGLSPDFVLFRSLSASDASLPELAEISKVSSVVRKRPELSVEHAGSALERAVRSGRVSAAQAANAVANLPSVPPSRIASVVAEVNLARQAPAARPADYQTAQSGVAIHYGSTTGERSHEPVHPESVRRSVSHLMNTGLSGRRLQAAVLGKFSRSQLSQVPQVGHVLAADDGVQGAYFIDPTAYSDYGMGCRTGSEHFRRHNTVPNLMASSGCTGCSCQTHPGWCSKYAKTLIRQVPESVRAEAAERRRLPVVQASAPVSDPVAEYELDAEMTVEVAAPRKPSLDIQLSSPSVSD